MDLVLSYKASSNGNRGFETGSSERLLTRACMALVRLPHVAVIPCEGLDEMTCGFVAIINGEP